MASAVYYRFRSLRDESKVTFDGAGISVSDLRKEIALANNLKLNDTDLLLFDSSVKELRDDLQIVPRSSLVIVKRVPARKSAKGKSGLSAGGITSYQNASVGGILENNASASGIRSRVGFSAVSRRFNDSNDRVENPKLQNTENSTDDEAAAMAAMFKAQTDVWEETQEKMSQAVPIFNNNQRSTTKGTRLSGVRQAYQQERPLPPSYVCYRCGKKGHWIHDCPTNNDRDYDNRPRIKRTTGIPRSFLKAVDSPAEGKPGHGIMVTPDGGYVVAQPDRASWQKQVSRTKGLTVTDVRERPPADPALACPMDKKLFLDPVRTPCCASLYCEECIHSHLLENDFVCPNCSKKINSLERLIVDKPMRTRVADYIDKVIKDIGDVEDLGSKVDEDLREVSRDFTVSIHTNSGTQGPPISADLQQSDTQATLDQQPYAGLDVEHLLNETIPQLQAQIAQLSTMLQNPNLPPQVRQTTLQQFHEYQLQLQQAHAFASLAADMNANDSQITSMMNQPMPQTQWFGNQQPTGIDSAYQRLPVNNRRRNNKRERPSDFLEVGSSDAQAKTPRFWE